MTERHYAHLAPNYVALCILALPERGEDHGLRRIGSRADLPPPSVFDDFGFAQGCEVDPRDQGIALRRSTPSQDRQHEPSYDNGWFERTRPDVIEGQFGSCQASKAGPGRVRRIRIEIGGLSTPCLLQDAGLRSANHSAITRLYRRYLVACRRSRRGRALLTGNENERNRGYRQETGAASHRPPAKRVCHSPRPCRVRYAAPLRSALFVCLLIARSRSGRTAPSTSGVRATPDASVARSAPPFLTHCGHRLDRNPAVQQSSGFSMK